MVNLKIKGFLIISFQEIILEDRHNFTQIFVSLRNNPNNENCQDTDL